MDLAPWLLLAGSWLLSGFLIARALTPCDVRPPPRHTPLPKVRFPSGQVLVLAKPSTAPAPAAAMRRLVVARQSPQALALLQRTWHNEMVVQRCVGMTMLRLATATEVRPGVWVGHS